MQAIVLDLEWNQPTNFRSGGYRQSGGQLLFEMIQIGAVKLDESRQIVDTFNQLIQPTCYRRLNPHVQKITHITQEQVDEAPVFQDAYESDFWSEKEPRQKGDPFSLQVQGWRNNLRLQQSR